MKIFCKKDISKKNNKLLRIGKALLTGWLWDKNNQCDEDLNKYFERIF